MTSPRVLTGPRTGLDSPSWLEVTVLCGEGPVAQENLGVAQAGNYGPSLREDPVRHCLEEDPSYLFH